MFQRCITSMSHERNWNNIILNVFYQKSYCGCSFIHYKGAYSRLQVLILSLNG